MFSYALSEPEAGCDAAAMKTRAVRDGDGWVLNGGKRWITNAGVSEYYTVMAVTDPDGGRQRHLRVRASRRATRASRSVRPSTSSASRAPRPASSTSTTAPSRPTGSSAREGEGFKIALRTLDHTRITIAAQAVGIAQGALDYALGYVKERKQFGRPVADFQGLQFMLADMAMKLEAARQLTYVAAAKSERAMSGESPT